MSACKFPELRRKLTESVGGEEDVRVLATLWVLSNRGTRLVGMGDNEPPLSIRIKVIAAKSKMSKKQARETLDRIADINGISKEIGESIFGIGSAFR